MTDAGTVAAAAARCIGTPFRPQGRTPGLALDCADVVIVALAAVNRFVIDLHGYRLHGNFEDKVVEALRSVGCHTTKNGSRAGDILLFRVAPLQFHLAVSSVSALIHAHAGVGRVVESPANPDWVIVARFRLPNSD